MLLVYKEKKVDLGYLAERLSQEFASATRLVAVIGRNLHLSLFH